MSMRDSNLISANKLKQDMKSMKLLRFLLPKDKRKELYDMEKKLNNILKQIELFNTRFSDLGWCSYDSINIKIIEKANKAFETDGTENGEKVLLDFYSSEAKETAYRLRMKCKPFRERYNLITKALDDHFEKRYHSSVVLFLIIIDGSVNDFTKSKGFFTEGTDLTVWDCLVGADSGLSKMRAIFNKGRNKTNLEEIRMPYRNGILHGRDINFDNAYVSCKCLSIMFALADWMNMKESEEKRKQKYEEEINPPSIGASIKRIQQNKKDRNEIDKWRRREVIIGTDIPKSPALEDCKEYPYLVPLIEMFSYWKSRNYGKLSKSLKYMFSYEPSDRKRAGECRGFFDKKDLVSFEIKEIEERACALTRVLINVVWQSNDCLYTGDLEFGIVYENEENDKEIALPWKENGAWIIRPWNITDLYNPKIFDN